MATFAEGRAPVPMSGVPAAGEHGAAKRRNFTQRCEGDPSNRETVRAPRDDAISGTNVELADVSLAMDGCDKNAGGDRLSARDEFSDKGERDLAKRQTEVPTRESQLSVPTTAKQSSAAKEAWMEKRVRAGYDRVERLIGNAVGAVPTALGRRNYDIVEGLCIAYVCADAHPGYLFEGRPVPEETLPEHEVKCLIRKAVDERFEDQEHHEQQKDLLWKVVKSGVSFLESGVSIANTFPILSWIVRTSAARNTLGVPGWLTAVLVYVGEMLADEETVAETLNPQQPTTAEKQVSPSGGGAPTEQRALSLRDGAPALQDENVRPICGIESLQGSNKKDVSGQRALPSAGGAPCEQRALPSGGGTPALLSVDEAKEATLPVTTNDQTPINIPFFTGDQGDNPSKEWKTAVRTLAERAVTFGKRDDWLALRGAREGTAGKTKQFAKDAFRDAKRRWELGAPERAWRRALRARANAATETKSETRVEMTRARAETTSANLGEGEKPDPIATDATHSEMRAGDWATATKTETSAVEKEKNNEGHLQRRGQGARGRDGGGRRSNKTKRKNRW